MNEGSYDQDEDVESVDEEKDGEESLEAGVVGRVDLEAVGRVPHFIELLGDLHSEDAQPHEEHEHKFWKVEQQATPRLSTGNIQLCHDTYIYMYHTEQKQITSS